MIKNKELEKILKNLGEKIRELKELQEEKDKLINFLSKYNKDEVVFDIKRYFFGEHSVVNYIYNGELKECGFSNPPCLDDRRFVIINNKSGAILQIGENYYKLDKGKNIVVDITDIYKPKTKTKKPSTKTTKTTKKK